MYATRRLWAGFVLVAALTAFAAVLERPLLVAGAALLGAWLLAQQVAFVVELARVREALSVDQDVERRGVRTGETTVATLEARLDRPARLPLSLAGGLPTATTAEAPLALSLAPGERQDAVATTARWPVAGRHRFSAATVTVASPYVGERFPVGPTPAVTVASRGSRRVHVGSGGTRIAAYGSHDGGQLGSGVEPSELREYTSSDTVRRIDWKATARLGTPYVREYETETDRQTLLIVDARPSTTVGPPGETKLEYLRDVALAMAEAARRQDDPVGLLTVASDGGYLEPASGPGPYTAVRRRLLDLEVGRRDGHAGGPTSETAGDSLAATLTRSRLGRRNHRSAFVDDDRFARTLRPFYADRGSTTVDSTGHPLPDAVRAALGHSRRRLSTIVFTDDSRPAELHDLVTLARQRGHELTLVLAPSVLYEPGGLAELDQAYARYLEFEELRRELARVDGVTALEAGPGDRLSAVLAAGRTRGERRG
ncbi:DUF58 domain-containing protein [Natronobeatus ordinarius]|uniref:DUF58 domain-containing protein n=1 Tax=Natronobeatus ordinarius TaxID=2963433 RepID=UPI0020CE0300|nr:DUF58 domain-containing protein [Natronobeatus ordinarius]